MAPPPVRKPVTLPPLLGHEAHARAVARAFLGGRLPPVLLIHGPPGVGKQRFGLWMGQLLLCEAPGDDGPCDACRHCGLARRLEHPDLHWYFPLERPPARGSQERQDEALEELRTARLAERRKEPLYPTLGSEGQGLHLGTIRNLRKRATQGPAMASRALFLIGNAEELAVQDVRAESANALLKLLEEPPRGLRFVLTSSEPGRVLPTIRSRAASLHLPAVPQDAVVRFLEEEAGADPAEARKAAMLSGGSPGRALGFLPTGEEEGLLQQTRREALRLIQAAVDEAPSAPFRRAMEVNAFGGRGMQELLGFVEAWLRDLGRAASSPHGDAPLLNQDVAEWIRRTCREREIHPLGTARALRWVQEAREHAAGNVNPQLILFGLLANLRRELRPASTPAPTGS
jgi:DNA polymerase III subunit delta'